MWPSTHGHVAERAWPCGRARMAMWPSAHGHVAERARVYGKRARVYNHACLSMYLGALGYMAKRAGLCPAQKPPGREALRASIDEMTWHAPRDCGAGSRIKPRLLSPRSCSPLVLLLHPASLIALDLLQLCSYHGSLSLAQSTRPLLQVNQLQIPPVGFCLSGQASCFAQRRRVRGPAHRQARVRRRGRA
jgi:hypothetical protein